MLLTRKANVDNAGDLEAFGTTWFLLRTNAGKERVAMSQVSHVACDVLLPLVQVRVRRWDKLVHTVGPLFPGYLFAMFDFESQYGKVRYARGVRELICFGPRPAVVPEWIVNELKQRCGGGPVELPERLLVPDDRVVVIGGPFKEFEGIFERYLSGRDRVAVLLSAMNARARAVLPAHLVIPAP